MMDHDRQRLAPTTDCAQGRLRRGPELPHHDQPSSCASGGAVCLRVDQGQGGQGIGEKQMHEMESNQSTDGKIIQGEVLRVEGNDCFIKGQDGKEVRLHIDLTTLKARNIEPGERIEAKVNDQNHVLAILSEPAVTDRRNDKE